MMDDRVEAIPDRLATANGAGVSMGVVLVVLLTVDLIIVTAVVAALAPHVLVWGILISVASPMVAFWALAFFAWRPWERRFPAKPQDRGAVVRINQSMQVGQVCRLNRCVHLAADDEHLHLIPFGPLRWFGAGVVSIPSRDFMRARVNGWRIVGPTWCMSLAAPAMEEGPIETA